LILKSADDKSSQLGQLEQRLTDRTLNGAQKQWLTDELFRLRMGIQGERDAAFYLDSHFKDSDNHVVIHDLRVEVERDVAQIDHLVLYRAGGIYLFETKNYGGSLLINDHGEFTADCGRVRYGIPSPIEQSRRHERVLHKLLDRLDIGGRTQRQLDMHHLVLVHPKAIIKRPAEKVFSTHNVMKADQFPAWHKKRTDNIGTLETFSLLANMRSMDTLREWGEKLIRQHRPAPMKTLPEHLFGTPQPAVARAPTSPASRSPASSTTDKAHLARKLICAECGTKISFAEGKFCWGNERRFGGLQYCREHQAMFR
jgi:Nuclease-related domain